MTSIAPQINYKSVEPSANPKYRFLRIPLNHINSQFTITATASQLLEWKLPNTVYNLAQSYIGYSVGIGSQGASPNFGNIHADCLEIATNAYFGTAGGLDICNLNYVNRYTKVWRKARTPFSEYISNDASSQLAPCNVLKEVNTIGGGGASSVNYLEPKYLDVSADAGVLNVNRMFPLKGIVDTIFSIDKDLYFPTDMYIRLTAGVGDQIAFRGVANPAGGAAALVGDVTIKNIYLYLAVEQNDLIVQSVMNKVLTSGLKLTIPYTTAFRNAVGPGAANVQLSLTQQYGRKLKRMINTFWNITENGYTAMDCRNTGAEKITTYNTFLDQRQLQDYPVSCAAPETATFALADLNSIAGDWRENKVHCKDSAILNRAVYQLNWFHCDQFYQPNDEKGADDSQNDDGLLMDAPKLYSFQGTTKAGVASIHYAFATFVRQVMVDRNGVQFV